MSCPCGSSFIADPDDPSLYRGATFDLQERKKKASASGTKRIRAMADSAIKALYDFWYRVQNIPLMTGRERYKTIAMLAMFLALILIAGYLVCGGKIGSTKDPLTV